MHPGKGKDSLSHGNGIKLDWFTYCASQGKDNILALAVIRKTLEPDPNWGCGGPLGFILTRRPRLKKEFFPVYPKRREAENVGFVFWKVKSENKMAFDS